MILTNIALKEARKAAGLTQVQVADRANISERAYQSYEAGKRVPNAHTSQVIAKVLGSSVDQLFPLVDQHENTKSPDESQVAQD